MKSILKIDLNTDTKIFLALLERFGGRKTKLEVSNTVVSQPWFFQILKFTSHFNHRRR